MSPSSRRPIDLARHAAALAARNGWTIERVVCAPAGGGGAQEVGGAGAAVGAAAAAFVVSGGELRAPALLRLEVVGEGDSSAGERPRIVSDHVPRALPPPVTRAARGRTVVARLSEHPAGGTLDDLLARGRAPAAGAAVTVLSAVARGLADIHACGWAGVTLGPADVGLRDDGCPVLTGIDRLRPFDRITAHADLQAYAALTRIVCIAVGGPEGMAVARAATVGADRSWDDVIRSLRRVADPIAAIAAQDAGAVASRDDVGRPGPAMLPGDVRDLDVTVLRSQVPGLGSTVVQDEVRNLDVTVLRGGMPVAGSALVRGGEPEVDRTVLRGEVAGLGSAAVPGEARDLDVTLLRGEGPGLRSRVVQGGLAETDVTGPRDGMPAVGRTVLPGETPEPMLLRGAAEEGMRAVSSDLPRILASTAMARAPANRPRRHRATPHVERVAVPGSAPLHRAMAVVERALERISDRPVARAVGAVGSWIVARPLVAAVAAVPLVGVLLMLLLVPSAGGAQEGPGDDVVGRSSPAPLRVNGTGPEG